MNPPGIECAPPGEFADLQFHPGNRTHRSARGAEIVSANQSLRELSPIIRHHHERFDGNGYPDGIQGQEIPLEARILCLVDSIQAMASNRPYRQAMSLPEIMSELKENIGVQFDPVVVQAALKIMHREAARLTASFTHTQPIKEPELVELQAN